MVRWNGDKDGKLLCSLFDNGIADPRKQAPAEIDPIKELKEEFKGFSLQTFRDNYRKTANKWINAKAVAGKRLKHLSCEWRRTKFSKMF